MTLMKRWWAKATGTEANVIRQCDTFSKLMEYATVTYKNKMDENLKKAIQNQITKLMNKERKPSDETLIKLKDFLTSKHLLNYLDFERGTEFSQQSLQKLGHLLTREVFKKMIERGHLLTPNHLKKIIELGLGNIITPNQFNKIIEGGYVGNANLAEIMKQLLKLNTGNAVFKDVVELLDSWIKDMTQLQGQTTFNLLNKIRKRMPGPFQPLLKFRSQLRDDIQKILLESYVEFYGIKYMEAKHKTLRVIDRPTHTGDASSRNPSVTKNKLESIRELFVKDESFVEYSLESIVKQYRFLQTSNRQVNRDSLAGFKKHFFLRNAFTLINNTHND